jgi:cytochrome c oxidase assembly protein subunit 15
LSRTEPYNRWLFAWACLTAAATFPLIVSGSTVTSLRVGMADDVWPTPPWYLLVVSWAETIAARGLGFFIEHGHRQLGWIVGVMVLVLAVAMFTVHRGSRLRWLGLFALLGVSIQGVIGGFRVRWHVTWGYELAAVHGVVGQIVFGYLVCLAAVLSRSWLAGATFDLAGAGRVRRIAATTLFLLIGQLVVGVWLRQFGGRSGAPILLHALFALGIVAHAILLLRRVRSEEAYASGLRVPVLLFNGMVSAQVALGVLAWLLGAGIGALDSALFPLESGGMLLVTLHTFLGAIVLATGGVVALRAWRHLNVITQPGRAALQAAGGAA